MYSSSYYKKDIRSCMLRKTSDHVCCTSALNEYLKISLTSLEILATSDCSAPL